MKYMYKINFAGLSDRDRQAIETRLKLLAKSKALACENEKFFLVFCPSGEAKIRDMFDSAPHLQDVIEITECSKSEFKVKEIIDFFDQIERAQIETLKSIGK